MCNWRLLFAYHIIIYFKKINCDRKKKRKDYYITFLKILNILKIILLQICLVNKIIKLSRIFYM